MLRLSFMAIVIEARLSEGAVQATWSNMCECDLCDAVVLDFNNGFLRAGDP